MADLQTIRSALAANLYPLRANRTVVQVSPYLLDNPTPAALLVAAVDDFEVLTFSPIDPAVRWTILIEAVLGKTSDVGSQRVLNSLLAPTGATSLVEAVEADQRLTSRLADDGTTLTTGQSEAADSVAFSEYRGQSRFTLENGMTVLLAVWAFEVLT